MEARDSKAHYVRLQNGKRPDLAGAIASANVDPRSSHRASLSALLHLVASTPALQLRHRQCELAHLPRPHSPHSHPSRTTHRSASTSNLLPKRDTPAHKSVADFVSQSAPNTRFTLEGEPDGDVARLCRVTPPANVGAARGYGAQGVAGVPLQPPREGDCVAVAMEGELAGVVRWGWDADHAARSLASQGPLCDDAGAGLLLPAAAGPKGAAAHSM